MEILTAVCGLSFVSVFYLGHVLQQGFLLKRGITLLPSRPSSTGQMLRMGTAPRPTHSSTRTPAQEPKHRHQRHQENYRGKALTVLQPSVLQAWGVSSPKAGGFSLTIRSRPNSSWDFSTKKPCPIPRRALAVLERSAH